MRKARRPRGKPIDRLVGQQIQARRVLKGLSQTELANELGVTFQQLQKYEQGTNRIIASRLYIVAAVIDVPIGHLFIEAASGPPPKRSARTKLVFDGMPASRETLQLVRYASVVPAENRRALIAFAKAAGRADTSID